MRIRFARALVISCGLFAAFFVGEFFLEWNRLGRPGADAVEWSGVNNTKLVDVLSPMARAYNNILAILLSTIGLAIPLTANMHTPKLIEMFLRDRLNQAMLFVIAFGAANVLYVDFIIGPKFAPMWAVRFAVYFVLAGWAALIPYFFYVVRFLDPSTIIRRLNDEVVRVIDDVVAGALDVEAAQDMVHERVYQIGTIVLKSLDRADRGVALEGIWTLKRLVDYHGARKAKMPAAWFKVDRKDFVGLSHEALEILNEDRDWFEMKALLQLFFAYQNALVKTSDVISSVSDAVRVIAVQAAARGDEPAVGLAIRFFNNFVREAIKRKDVHSVYDVFYEYRVLARDLSAHPDRQREIARHVRHYATTAKAAGIPFVEQLAAFELGYIVRRAYEGDSPAARELLGEALSVPRLEGDGKPIPMAIEAMLLLGAFFVQKGRDAEAKLVGDALANVPAAAVRDAETKMLGAERWFFEVTDRQENLEYVKPERREPLKRFVASVVG